MNASAHEQMEKGALAPLMAKYCIPSLAGSLVTAVYNIVDQIFIGNDLGSIGNAATNVVFPAVTLLTAVSLMCGVGTSAAMNLSLGRGSGERAAKSTGCGISLMVLTGLVLTAVLLLFAPQLLMLFGCTEMILPYALRYARILSLGFVFSILSASGPFVIRADGASGYALAATVSGALLNILLDWIFVCRLKMSIEGAAIATVISQAIGAGIVMHYLLRRFSAVKLSIRDYVPSVHVYCDIIKLGAGPAINFLSQALVQILLNNALKGYGALSAYGSEITLAAAGVANKVNTLASALFTGLANGSQPIISYNFGRKNYARVRKAGITVVSLVVASGLAVTLLYQLVPVQITKLFGEGTDAYYAFAASFFRIYLMLVCFQGLTVGIGGFFSAQGKPLMSIVLSASRQLVILPILLCILPRMFGLQGVLCAGPLADGIFAVIAFSVFFRYISKMGKNRKAE